MWCVVCAALPVEEKKCFLGTGGSATAGATYSGLDAGQAEPAYDPTQTASVRSWDYARPALPRAGDLTARPQLPWPTPTFRDTIDELYDRQNLLGVALLEAFAEVLDLPRHTFAEHFQAGDMGTIRLLSYPGEHDDGDGEGQRAGEATDVGIAPHTDFEVFTLMHQSAPGLQFLPVASAPPQLQQQGQGQQKEEEEEEEEAEEEEWVDAPVVASDFVVIVGDVLERYTNGVLKATPHRVRNSTRYSTRMRTAAL
jgi:isopenicillin N synthase-like dioxygenase